MAIETEPIVTIAAEALDAKKARDILALDVRELSGITDYYLIATGSSAPHLKALSDEVDRRLKHQGHRRFRMAGTPDSGWIALDYFSVVVHLFVPDARAFYDLERLWKDAPRIELSPDPAATG